MVRRRAAQLLRYLRARAIDALLAGLAIAALEWCYLAKLPGPIPMRAATAASVVALSIAVAALVLVLLRPAMYCIGRHTWIRSWLAALRAGGQDRAAAAFRALIALIAAALLGLAVIQVSGRAQDAFKAVGAIALLVAAFVVAIAVVIVGVAIEVDHRLTERLARARHWQRFAASSRNLIVASIALAATAVWLADSALSFLAPHADVALYWTALGAIVAVALTRLVPGGLYRHRWAANGLCVASGALLVIGLVVLDNTRVPRGLISLHGAISGSSLRTLSRLTDSDGDGFPSFFGGADCNDDNPAIHPMATEILENGIDEDCSGGDLTRAQLVHRTREVPSQFAGAPKHNVVLISLDTIRADHVKSYGYPRNTTPHLDALAARGTLFEWTISASPTTRRAVPSMMTASYSSAIAWQEGKWIRMQPKLHTLLGESFAAHGYQTFAILCCKTLFDAPHGVVEGIESVDHSAAEVLAERKKKRYNGDAVAERVVAYFEDTAKTSQPFFLWTHIIDPHAPYFELPGARRFGNSELDRYDSELSYVDARVGEMLEAIDKAGLRETTIVAIISDHGEGFEHEHGNKLHGNDLFNESVRVPMIISVPNAAARRIRRPVSMIDLGPTLLDLVGAPRPAGQNGISHAAAVRDGTPIVERMVLAELLPDYAIKGNLRAGFWRDWKIVWDVQANTLQLFWLSRDHDERKDLLEVEVEQAVKMQEMLHDAVQRELTPLVGSRK